MIRRPPRSTLDRSSAASDVYKRQVQIFDDDKVLEFIFSKQVIDDRVELAIQSVDLESGLGHLEGKIGGEVVQRFCFGGRDIDDFETCLLYTSPSPRDRTRSRMPSSA